LAAASQPVENSLKATNQFAGLIELTQERGKNSRAPLFQAFEGFLI
jgi:hypothetical protein